MNVIEKDVDEVFKQLDQLDQLERILKWFWKDFGGCEEEGGAMQRRQMQERILKGLWF